MISSPHNDDGDEVVFSNLPEQILVIEEKDTFPAPPDPNHRKRLEEKYGKPKPNTDMDNRSK